jgi:hypothetical protein
MLGHLMLVRQIEETLFWQEISGAYHTPGSFSPVAMKHKSLRFGAVEGHDDNATGDQDLGLYSDGDEEEEETQKPSRASEEMTTTESLSDDHEATRATTHNTTPRPASQPAPKPTPKPTPTPQLAPKPAHKSTPKPKVETTAAPRTPLQAHQPEPKAIHPKPINERRQLTNEQLKSSTPGLYKRDRKPQPHKSDPLSEAFLYPLAKATPGTHHARATQPTPTLDTKPTPRTTRRQHSNSPTRKKTRVGGVESPKSKPDSKATQHHLLQSPNDSQATQLCGVQHSKEESSPECILEEPHGNDSAEVKKAYKAAKQAKAQYDDCYQASIEADSRTKKAMKARSKAERTYQDALAQDVARGARKKQKDKANKSSKEPMVKTSSRKSRDTKNTQGKDSSDDEAQPTTKLQQFINRYGATGVIEYYKHKLTEHKKTHGALPLCSQDCAITVCFDLVLCL